MDDAQRRADERRRTYEGEIVGVGTPKPRLRAESFTLARPEEMWALCVAQSQAAGREMRSFTRSEMPGEVFRIDR